MKQKSKKVAYMILSIYVMLVCYLQLSKTDDDIIMPIVLFVCVLGVIVSCALMKIAEIIIDLLEAQEKGKRQDNKKVFYIVFIVTFLVFETYFYLQYPGGFSPDSIIQYTQAISGKYSNWHPVLHTLLFFTIPIKLGGGLGLIVFLQQIYFSLAFSYLMYVLYKNGIQKNWFIVLCVFVWVNPYLMVYLMFPWKDLAFMIFAMILVAQYIEIMLSNGEWLNKKLNLIALTIISVICNYMRHNGVLFIIPLLAIILIYFIKNWRKRIQLVLYIAIGFVFVQVLYLALDVEKPGSRTLETVGMPATIWCSVMKNNPQSLPESIRGAMYELASQEQYDRAYVEGDFNSIKFSKKIDTSKINKLSYREVVKYTWNCFKYAPRESIRGLATLTSLVWGVEGEDTVIETSIQQNPFGIEKKNDNLLQITGMKSIRDFYNKSHITSLVFGTYGIQILIMLAIGLVLFAKHRISIIHILPLLCYDFGTMLLLSGRDYRFFLLNIPLFMPMIFVMIKDKNTFKKSIQKD